MQYILPLVVITLMHHVTTAPTNHIQAINKKIKPIARQKKGPDFPFQIHHILVPNLQVIPIQGSWSDPSHNITQHNILIPIHNLVPIHELVPVNRLTVIPLQKEHTVRFHVHDEDRFRNPLGGYGVGWRFGGHGAGHGFHYSYG